MAAPAKEKHSVLNLPAEAMKIKVKQNTSLISARLEMNTVKET
jgi:hypothetical protein